MVEGHAVDVDALGYWQAGLRLDPRANVEWTFHLFVFRAGALSPPAGPELVRGLDLFYEPLFTWEDLAQILMLRERLAELGVDQDYLPTITIGYEAFQSGRRAPRGVLPMPSNADRFLGKHSVSAVDLEDDTTVRFQNSWGPHWGDGGFGYFSKGYFEAHVDAVWLVRPAWIGPSPSMESAVKQRLWQTGRAGMTASLEDVAAHWTTGNRPFAREVHLPDGRPARIAGRRLHSLRGSIAPAAVLQVELDGEILGRAHVEHDRASGLSSVTELYVSPSSRGLGVGRLLVAHLEELGSHAGTPRMEIAMHDADATPGGIADAQSFGAALGYSWEAQPQRRPNLLAVMRRNIDVCEASDH